MFAKSVRDLDVYQSAFEAQQEIFELTKTFPKEEMYSLTDQIRRSSRSVGANLSEAWAKRRYQAHFISKLSDADGETEETSHWLVSAFACKYLTLETKEKLMGKYLHISNMLNKMITDSDKWCASFSANQKS